MSFELQIYTDPLDAHASLRHYGGFQGIFTPNIGPSGRQGQVLTVPDDVPNGHGAEITIEKEGYIGLTLGGFLMLADKVARLQADDFHLVPLDNTDPEEPIPVPGDTPEEIIQYVYESTNPKLSTHDGCGKFTGDVQKALSDSLSVLYGHIAKEPGQNQYDGRAVDAIMLLMDYGGVAAGVYDIIKDSVSPNAQPAFNWVGPPDSNLWFNPSFESVKLVARKK